MASKNSPRAAGSTDPERNGIRAGKGEYLDIDGRGHAARTGHIFHVLIPPFADFVISTGILYTIPHFPSSRRVGTLK
jgi:hypothetical protein